MTAATSERGGTLQPGWNFPASPEASSAPSMMPKSITEVMSANTLSLSDLARSADCQ